MDTDLLLANNNLKSASDKREKIYSSIVEMQTGMRSSSRDFYYRLSLMAGGIISLDITFIGYLVSKSTTLYFSELLFLSWTLLIMGLIGALYRNHYNLDMGHYQTTIILNTAYLEEFQAKLLLLKLNPASFINLKSQKEVDIEIDLTEKNILTVKDAIKNMEKKEKTNSRSWVISQGMAHTGFVSGLILTTIFASLNLPATLDFTLFKLLINIFN